MLTYLSARDSLPALIEIVSFLFSFFSRVDGDDPSRQHPVAACRRVPPPRRHLRQPPQELHQLVQEDPRRERAGEAGRGQGPYYIQYMYKIDPYKYSPTTSSFVLHADIP